MRFIPFIILLWFGCLPVTAQQYYIKGKIINAVNNSPLKNASIEIIRTSPIAKLGITSDTSGLFSAGPFNKGEYKVSITYLGFEKYTTSVVIAAASVDMGEVYMTTKTNTLDEVKIVEKIVAVAQKEDTTEYNAAAFKVNPDADAADLVRKMPTVDVSGKEVKAQGEKVTKVLIDGKPFFGDDPYASLRNLPAEVIDKVQVYNEKSEQELFTGFSEGNTTKTINIITKANKRHGKFGKLYVGYGGDDRYLAGGSINSFLGDKRITVTAQSNNVNMQNFSEQNLVSASGNTSGGIATNHSVGLNYSDKWGKKVDITGSYAFSESNNSYSRNLRREDNVLVKDSAQVYTEQGSGSNSNVNHRFNLRLNYNIDSANSILFTPSFGIQQNTSHTMRHGVTMRDAIKLNSTDNNTTAAPLAYNITFNTLYRHKFRKKGRTFSLGANAGYNNNSGTDHLSAVNDFDTVHEIQDQHVIKDQYAWNISANAAYTEPLARRGLLQLQYNINYTPARSARDVYDYDPVLQSYTSENTLLSNTFQSANMAHKAGASYQVDGKKYRVSAGLYYQLSQLKSEQVLPDYSNVAHHYSNLLPTAHFQYRFSKTNNIDITYSTSASAPSVTQLQKVVNNTNPLFLSTGNPDLRQPYLHNLNMRYNITNPKKATNFYIGMTGAYGFNSIANNTIIAQADEMVNGILLRAGSQLSMPVNMDGYENLTAYVNYSLPLTIIKSNFGININSGYTHAPLIINGGAGFSDSRNAGMGINLSSNINENIDFTFSSSWALSSSTSAQNQDRLVLYFNQDNKLLFNLIFWKGFVFNTDFSYQHNGGLSSGYNTDYMVWNLGFGKKLFKKRAGDIRIVFYDVLNQNTNIQHTISPAYIMDVHTNAVKRYFLLTFTYNIRSFTSK